MLEQDEKYQNDYRNRIFAELTAGKALELGMPDGTTWLEEYLDFPENCEPEHRIPRQISSIIFEEVKSYFEWDKSAGDVAKIIHNRVQLYLDENS